MLSRLWRKLVCGLRFHRWGEIYINPVKDPAKPRDIFQTKCVYCGTVSDIPPR